MDALEAGYT